MNRAQALNVILLYVKRQLDKRSSKRLQQAYDILDEYLNDTKK